MRGNLRSIRLLATVMVLLAMLAGPFLMSSTTILQGASAATREFEENITIPANNRTSLELGFTGGDELELIFTVKVKENLPIYFWFVNSANYVRLVDGSEFLFFIDGSDQNVTQASKVVSVTVYDIYKMVLFNYNDVPVEVYITYDVNIYPREKIRGVVLDEQGDPIEDAIVQVRDSAGSIVATSTTGSAGDFEFIDTPFGTYNLMVFADGFEDNNKATATISMVSPTVDVGSIELTAIEETPFWELPIFMLPLGLVIGILVGLLASRMTMRSGIKAPKAAAKVPSKKARTSKGKKPRTKVAKKAPSKKAKVTKAKKAAPEVTDTSPSEEADHLESEKEEPEVVEKAAALETETAKKTPSPRFCGHCGKPVETQFCPFCGKEVGKA